LSSERDTVGDEVTKHPDRRGLEHVGTLDRPPTTPQNTQNRWGGWGGGGGGGLQWADVHVPPALGVIRHLVYHGVALGRQGVSAV
jgi:hypothetical protein